MKRKCLLVNLIMMISPFLGSDAALADAATKQFDGRAWTIGNRQQSSTQILTEYVLPGQTVDNWKELVTSQVRLIPDGVPLAEFMEIFVGTLHTKLMAGCPSLVWNVVRQDKKRIIYEWHDSGCGGFAPQGEIDRVAVSSHGVKRLAYTAYIEGAFPVEKRNTWLEILGRVPLVEELADSTASAWSSAQRPVNASSNEIETAALARQIDKLGQTCQSGISSERLPAKNGLEQWNVECSDGHKYSVIRDPSGAFTVFKTGP